MTRADRSPDQDTKLHLDRKDAAKALLEQWKRAIREVERFGDMALPWWSEDRVPAQELDIELTLVSNYEDIWIEAKDPSGQIDFAETDVEFSPAGSGTWTTCRRLQRCIGATDSRHVGVIVHDIDGTVLKNTSYDVRLTFDGRRKTATTTTRDDPAQFTCSTVTSPLTTSAAIRGAIGSDTEIVVADGDYWFGGLETCTLSTLNKFRIRPENPGMVRFHGWQDVNGLDGSWTNVGSGAWSHAVTGGLADKQYAVFHDKALLVPADNLATLQDARAGWTRGGDGIIYVKLTNLSKPAAGSVRISNSANLMTINQCTEVDIDGIIWEGCLLTNGFADAGGVDVPRTIDMFGTNTDVTFRNNTVRNTATLNRSTIDDSLVRFTVEDNLFADGTKYLWFNGLKNQRAAVGLRNYESLSGFSLFNDNNADQQIVCRRNTWTKGNSAWTYGDATANTGTVRPEKTMIAMSVYENISGDGTLTNDTVTIDDAFEPNGNLIGVSVHNNKVYTGGVLVKTGVHFVGPMFITNNNVARFGKVADLETSVNTKFVIRLQRAAEQTAPTGTCVAAHNTFAYDTSQEFPLFPGVVAGHWASYVSHSGVDHRGLSFHDNIWRIATSAVGLYWMHLMQDAGYSFQPNNDILHDGDIFHLSGPGGEFFANRGGSPTTIAGYNTAAKTGGGSNIDRLTNCLQQPATLQSDYLPSTPVAKVAGRPGYGALTNRGSNIALY